HGADRAELLFGVIAHEAIDFADFGVGQAGVGFGEGDKLAAVIPDAEGVIGVEAGALAGAALRIDQYGVDGVGINLPFPPAAVLTADMVGRVELLEHEPLDAAVAGFFG